MQVIEIELVQIQYFDCKGDISGEVFMQSIDGAKYCLLT